MKVRNPNPKLKTAIAIISGMSEATDFRLGRKIHRVHPNKSSLKMLGEKKAWAYPGSGTAQIFWVTSIISRTGKATNFKFCTHIHNVNWKKTH